MTTEQFRTIINEKLPAGRVVPRHNDRGHFYAVGERVYPSVTGKLQVLKDESLINYKMNQAVQYVFAHHKKFSDENIMEHMDNATRAATVVLEDAGDIGTRIHTIREEIFKAWIANNKKPESFMHFIPVEAGQVDLRALSAIRALEKFCLERDYIPIVSELLVYDEELEVAGTLDDIGLMRIVMRGNVDTCISAVGTHSLTEDEKGFTRCQHCKLKYRYDLVLMDLKTSNQFKDHYFFQVAMYFLMFKRLTGLTPKKCFILKLSKENGTYSIEELRQMGKLCGYAKHMLKTNEALDFIRKSRKDNQKVVGEVIKL